MGNGIVLMGNTHFSECYQKQMLLNLVGANLWSQFVNQQMENLSRKVRFIPSLESNSAVEPDCLISVLFEINALNVNALLLATSTTIKPDPTWGCPYWSLRSRTSRLYTSKYGPSLVWSWMGASKQYLFAEKVAVLPLDHVDMSTQCVVWLF